MSDELNEYCRWLRLPSETHRHQFGETRMYTCMWGCGVFLQHVVTFEMLADGLADRFEDIALEHARRKCSVPLRKHFERCLEIS